MTRALTSQVTSLLGLVLALAGLLPAAPARAQDDPPSAQDDGLGLDDVGDDDDATPEPDGDSDDGDTEQAPASERVHASTPPPNPDLEPEPDAEPTASEGKHDNRVRVQASIGGGVGTRAYVRPAKTGAQRLKDTPFPAVDLGLQVQIAPASTLSWEVLVRYQSSIAFHAHEEPDFALPDDVDVRAERAEISLAPRLRLGADPDSAALAFAVGLGVRTFWPDIDESITPAFSLIGPQLRVELVLPITPSLSLRAGPEAQWIIGIDTSLQELGVGAQGIALGGEARLQLELGPVFSIELAYRESHATASTTRGATLFEDVERFATARLGGRL